MGACAFTAIAELQSINLLATPSSVLKVMVEATTRKTLDPSCSALHCRIVVHACVSSQDAYQPADDSPRPA